MLKTDAYISEARNLYRRFQTDGTRTALIQSMRKVNAAMCALFRFARHCLFHPNKAVKILKELVK